MQNKRPIPRIPIDPNSYDLTGVKIDRNAISDNRYAPYKPNVNGNLVFVLFLSENYFWASSHIDNIDLSKGQLFLINIPYSCRIKFIQDFYKAFGATYRLNIVNGITIDTIFDVPIYDTRSFKSYVKYHTSSFGFIDDLGKPVDAPKLRKANNEIITRDDLYLKFHWVLREFRCFISYNCGHVYETIKKYDSVFPIKYDLFGSSCKKEYKGFIKWKGSMDSLSKFTYSSTPEQLKLAWNTRHLDLIEF